MSAKKIWFWAVLLPVLTFLGQGLCLLPAPRFLGWLASAAVFSAVYTIFFVLFGLPACVYFAVVGLVRYKKPGETLRAFSKSLGWLCLSILICAALLAGTYVRHLAFVRASHVGDRIVECSRSYKQRTGSYPDTLKRGSFPAT